MQARLSKDGIFNDPKWYRENPFTQSGFGLPNCTCYAWGRAYELLGSRPKLPMGNAGTWYKNCTAYEKGQEPRVGAVVVWSGNTYGHVGVVERILANGDIMVSQSNYNRAFQEPHRNDPSFFWVETAKKKDGYRFPWSRKYGHKLEGFIYLPIEEEERKEVEDVKRYNKIEEVPEWGRETVQKLIDKGALQGDGGNLNLSEDMLRVFVINDRAEAYDKKD